MRTRSNAGRPKRNVFGGAIAIVFKLLAAIRSHKSGERLRMTRMVVDANYLQKDELRDYLSKSADNKVVVPFNSFSEFNKAEGGDIWFAFDDSRPLACFAGIISPALLTRDSDSKPRQHLSVCIDALP